MLIGKEKDTTNALRNMTVGKLCDIIGVPYPVGISLDTKCLDVLGSPIAAKKGSAVIQWKGEKSDGAELVRESLEKGSCIVFCRQSIKKQSFPDDIRVVGVDNPSSCITKYIKFARDCFDVKVVTVTGSVGKTTTMEMLTCVLGSQFVLHRGKSIENSKGAVLRLTQQLDPSDEVYLQEVGAAEPHHVESMAKGLCPDIAVITNIGTPHLDKYKTQENILKDKASLIECMKDDGVGVLDMDNEYLRNYKTNRKIVYYAIEHHDADYYAENIEAVGDDQAFDVVCRDSGERYRAIIHVRGVHNVRNALAAFAVGTQFGIDAERIVEALALYLPQGVRQNVVEIGGYKLFLDMFNSSPETLLGSVKVLEGMEVPEGGKRIVIAGDIARLGDYSQKGHYNAGLAIGACKVDEIICFGEDALQMYKGVRKAGFKNALYTKDRETLNNLVRERITRKDIVLFKGSQIANLASTVDAVFGTTYYHEYQGVFASQEDVDIEYRNLGDYVECSKVKSVNAKSLAVQQRVNEKTVRRIGNTAFQECRNLREVQIPEGVVNIGTRAFYICPQLEMISLPTSLRMIERSAFNYCRSLKAIVIPEGVISLGSRVFYDCINLESVTLPASVGFIGEEAFAHCPKVVVNCEQYSYAEEYCLNNGVRFRSFPKENAMQSQKDELEGRYKLGDLYYEKEANDYHFEVRREPDYESRFQANENVWRQTTVGQSGKAVLACAGDLMCEPVMCEAAYGNGQYCFDMMFKQISPVLHAADFSIANLETTVTSRFPYSHEMHVIKHHTGARYHCNAPLQYLDALRYAGFDGFVLANNHDADCGYEGIVDTLANLDARSFAHTGMFGSEEDHRVLVVDVNGIRIGFISYTEHINRHMDEEILTPVGIDVMLNHFSVEKLTRDVETARADGVEFLICYIHFLGTDYSNEVHPNNAKLARTIAEAGVDCIMGSHMHAVQKYEQIATSDGRIVPVVYSLGNFVTSESKEVAKESIVYMLTLEKENGAVGISKERYVPCYVLEGYLRSSFVVHQARDNGKTDATSLLLAQKGQEISTYIGGCIEPITD